MSKLNGEAFAQLHNAINVSTSDSLEQKGVTSTFGAEVSDNFEQAGNVLSGIDLGM
ncbi:MAG: hypothetical protein ACRBB3_05635 [Alphaproteobacteria bacterium]